jgi:hypothetical protein
MLRGRRLASGIAPLVLLCGLIAACDGPAPTRPAPVNLSWSALSLPMPPGEPGRIAVRDAAVCGGHWYVVGAVFGLDQSAAVVHGPQGETRPAIWTSTDGTSWTAVPVHPHTYYGRRDVMYAAACRDGRLAAIGARSGGAHGNPRVSTWRQLPNGGMEEVEEPFETYGGPAAVKASRMAAGPPGWLIAGERTSGAAAWLSADASDFEVVEGAPELASDDRGSTTGDDAAFVAGRWVIVGGILPRGRGDRDPMAWSSPDGRSWVREAVPGTTGWDELHRVAATGGGLLAAGPRGPTFGTWRYTAGAAGQPGVWREAGGFGATGHTGLASVTSLAATPTAAFAMVSDGAGHELWMITESGDVWRPAPLPAPAPVGADRTAAVAADGERVLVLVDDGGSGRAWMAGLID